MSTKLEKILFSGNLAHLLSLVFMTYKEIVLFALVSLCFFGCPPVCVSNSKKVVHCQLQPKQEDAQFAQILPAAQYIGERNDSGDTQRTMSDQSSMLNWEGIRRISSEYPYVNSVLLLLTQIEPVRQIVLEIIHKRSQRSVSSRVFLGSPDYSLRIGVTDIIYQQWVPGDIHPLITLPPEFFAQLSELEDDLAHLLFYFIDCLSIPLVSRLFTFDNNPSRFLKIFVQKGRRSLDSDLSESAPVSLRVDPAILKTAGDVLIINISITSRSTVVTLPLTMQGSTFAYWLIGFVSIESGEIHTVYRHFSKAQLGQDRWYWDNGETLRQVPWASIQKEHSGLPQMAVYQRTFDVSQHIFEEDDEDSF